jgi:hypothetical protein
LSSQELVSSGVPSGWEGAIPQRIFNSLQSWLIGDLYEHSEKNAGYDLR